MSFGGQGQLGGGCIAPASLKASAVSCMYNGHDTGLTDVAGSPVYHW